MSSRPEYIENFKEISHAFGEFILIEQLQNQQWAVDRTLKYRKSQPTYPYFVYLDCSKHTENFSKAHLKLWFKCGEL